MERSGMLGDYRGLIMYGSWKCEVKYIIFKKSREKHVFCWKKIDTLRIFAMFFKEKWERKGKERGKNRKIKGKQIISCLAEISLYIS